jgi:hypothetical protein
MSAKAGLTRIDAGTHRPRHRPLIQYPPQPVDPVKRALKGPMFWGQAVTAEEWERLRVSAWERYEVEQDWPPHAARHDGIRGDALRLSFAPPEGYRGRFDARPKIRALADQGLAEVEAFRKSNPEAARSIAKPLREYERRLRKVREHPERLLLAGSGGPAPSS